MTRAASGAQRSGAAALNLSRLRDILLTSAQYSGSSFFVPRTPARWGLQKGWRRPGGSTFTGSVVLYGSGGRTAKRLKSNGSMVPFQSLTRDACADARARTHIETPQNHRTIEPRVFLYIRPPLSGSAAVLCPVRSRTGNKQWGEYPLLAFADPSRPDQGPCAGSARGKFRRRVRLGAAVGASAGAIGAVAQLRDLVERNRAISAGYAGRCGRVGMGVSERLGIIVADQCLGRTLRQPAGLAGHAAGAGRDLGGLAADRRGGTPPIAAPALSSSLAQPIFCVSVDLRIRRPVGRIAPGAKLDAWKSGRGSGSYPASADRMRDAPASRSGFGSGCRGCFLVPAESREPATLWGGSTHVN